MPNYGKKLFCMKCGRQLFANVSRERLLCAFCDHPQRPPYAAE